MLTEMLQNRRKIYSSVNLKVAALRVGSKWYNCRAVAVFSCDEVEKDLEKLVAVENFVVFSQQGSVYLMWRKLLDIIGTGKTRIGDQVIHFTDETIAQKTSANVVYEDSWSRSSEQSKEYFGIDWPADYFSCRWSTQIDYGNVIRSANYQVQCYNPPFENVRDAVQSLLNSKRRDLCTSGSHLWLILPTYLAIDKCILDGGLFKVFIRFNERISLADALISLIGKGPKTRRKQVRFKKETSTKESPVMVATSLEEVSSVKTILFLESDKPHWPIDTKEVRNRRSQINKRITAHEVFDVESEKFLSYIQSEELRDSKKFEWAIATLLHFCGFQTEWLSPGSGEAPDVLGYYPEEDTLIVGECTVGVPNKNKILKLLGRAEQLKPFYSNVLAVVFSNVEQMMLRDVPSITEIKILDRENIKTMIDMASRGSSTKQIYSYIFERSVIGL